MLEVLYEDNHLLAINKPAALPTMGVAEDRESLLGMAKEYVRRKYNKPGNVYLGIVSRLDAPVTGVVLMARTSKAAGRLSAQFRDREVEKVYLAIVEGTVGPRSGLLVDHVRKDERHRRMHLARPGEAGAQEARLKYERIGDDPTPLRLVGRRSLSLLEVQLLTGRKHQIRLQLSSAGFPILGDRKYGSTHAFPNGIALHSRRLVIEHPVSKIQLAIEAPLPASWRRFVDGR